MRDILFRGKDVETGMWVTGDLLQNEEGVFIVADSGTETQFGETDLYATDWYKVDPKTVGQYTGLKDSKGKEIYEGDIVKGGFIMGVGCVYYDDHDAIWCVDDHSGATPSFAYLLEHVVIKDGVLDGGITVIGNKFDNPELLEESE